MIDFLELHYYIHKGYFFNDKISNDSFNIYYSKNIEDNHWNFAAFSELSTIEKNFENLCEIFSNINRRPCLYLSHNQAAQISDLHRKELRITYSISVLKYTGVTLENFHPVHDVINSEDEENFLKVYEEVNSVDKASSIAGGVTPAHMQILKSALKSPNFYHFITYDGKTPVAVATLANYNGYCKIINLSTKLGYRGKGYTQSIVRACIDRFYEINGKEIFILIPSTSYVENWYLKNDFKKITYGFGLQEKTF